MDLTSFFNPKRIAVVGVSDNLSKLSSVIFHNIIEAGYEGELIGVNPKLAGQEVLGKKVIASVSNDPTPFDLVVVVVPGKLANAVVDDCIINKTKNISIISAGFAETGNQALEQEILKKCLDNGINLLGPNCLGHISTHNKLNASFADGFPLAGNVAFISQSGAFCSAMMDWAKNKEIGFSHFISVGNKAHLSESELLEAIKDDPNTSVFVFYLESLKNGQKFLELIKEVTKTKPVIILEPGKSQKAQAASMSHTGNLAPNYRVLEMAYEQAGAIKVNSTREMFGLVELLNSMKHNRFEGKMAILTNAGGVGVLTSDLCEDSKLDIGSLSKKTEEQLRQGLPEEAALGNPIDLIGDAKADRYEFALNILCKDDEIDNILVLLTPQRVTDVKNIAEAIAKVAATTNKNIITSFIGGYKVAEGLDVLEKAHIVNFNYPVDATKLLGLLKNQRLNCLKTESEVKVGKADDKIVALVEEAKAQKLQSLPQSFVNVIMEHYGIDFPKSNNFTDKAEALKFCEKFFPNKMVLKLSAPDALHKTELRGIYLNIDNETKFNEGWEGLWNTINKAGIANASILIQEQISSNLEIIVGVNTDDNFGKVMIFGTGGIYTEVWKDTSLRVLPAGDVDKMIDETKIGEIVKGVRGENPRAVEPLKNALRNIQRLVLELPQINAIDANPILVTNDRAVVVDFKMIL